MSSQQQKRREPWRNPERHYCAVCNVWMGSDKQSIMLHENGKKHKENVEKSLKQKRSDKLQQQKDQNYLQASLAKMEQAAMQSMGGPATTAGSFESMSMMSRGGQPPPIHSMGYPHHPAAAMQPPPPMQQQYHQHQSKPPPPPAPPQQSKSKQDAKSEWAAKSRKEKRRRQREGGDDDDELYSIVSETSSKKIKLQPGEGHYDDLHGNTTYLEGNVFSNILEQELPIQLWTGSVLATPAEKRLPEKDSLWKDAIVAAIHKKRKKGDDDDGGGSDGVSIVVHVSYLASDEAEDETLEKSVDLGRIRMVLGGHDHIPGNIEEARLLQMGGEEINVEDSTQPLQADESTGLSGWSAVTIKRTTIRNELKEERERHREARREKQLEREEEAKKAEARRMEEAKVADADDSALGAYDVWGTGGYKGIDILQGGGGENNSSDVSVSDLVQKEGGSVGGGDATKKKKTSFAFKKKKKPANKRQTRVSSADD